MSVNPQAGAGRRILVIEDEFLVADYVAGMLEDLGYEVVGPVSTIADAIATISSEKLDAVLLDANLRGMSSAPVASELSMRQLPFIVATGYGNLELATAALQAAPRLNKPFNSAALAAVLAKTLAL